MRLMRPVCSLAILIASVQEAEAHGYLAMPPSKNGANMQSYKLKFQDYYLRTNWWVDKAYLDSDPNKKPWSKPGKVTYETTWDINKQVFMPCGCYNPGNPRFCAGVELASKFGEITPGHTADKVSQIKPPKWPKGSSQDTAYNMYANHAGGYIYALCKKTTWDKCKKEHLPTPMWTATKAHIFAYEKCVWNCFFDNVLDFVNGTQAIQFGDNPGLTVHTKVITKGPHGTLPKGSVWRESPLPDRFQKSAGHSDHGRCVWDAIDSSTFSSNEAKRKFTEAFGDSSSCDSGKDLHGPSSWHIKDKVQVPSNLPEGEYLLMWRWECGVADQLWSNCADVEIVSSNTPTPEPEPEPEPKPVCKDIVGNVSHALPAAWLPQWAGGDPVTCDSFNLLGKSFCGHVAIKKACCFCGGGDRGGARPTPAAPPTPPTPMPSTPPSPAHSTVTATAPVSPPVPTRAPTPPSRHGVPPTTTNMQKTCRYLDDHMIGIFAAYTCRQYQWLGKNACDTYPEVSECCFCATASFMHMEHSSFNQMNMVADKIPTLKTAERSTRLAKRRNFLEMDAAVLFQNGVIVSNGLGWMDEDEEEDVEL